MGNEIILKIFINPNQI